MSAIISAFIDAVEVIECVDGPRIEREAIKKNRFVFREKMKIVVQHDQIVFLNLRVGRIGILEVDRAVRERRVAERVIDSTHVSHR